MAREYARTDRLGEQIQRELAEILMGGMRDPRLGMVTITAVEVARDLAHAKVFFTVMLEDQREDSIEALHSAAGFLRSEVGKRIRTRSVPQLHFLYDESVEKGAQMDRLINQAIAADRPADEQAGEQADDQAGDEQSRDD